MNLVGVLAAIAFILSLALVKLLIGQFQQKLIDLPNERSSHTRPTPRGGGLGFILSFYTILGFSNFLNPSPQPISNLIWLSLLPLVVMGFIDDWKNLPASIRYLVQISVAAIAVTQLGAFPLFPDQTSHLFLNLGAIALTTIGMTALINFYNFMDGLDGLIAGTAIVQLSVCAIWSNNPTLWILVTAIGGFLIWNWNPAKIFMGDSGSTFIGAVVAIALLSKNTTPSDAWATLTLTLPITLDTIYTLIRRLMRHENIFQAHRSHLFQRLHQSGWSHAQVSSLYIVASLTLSLTLLNLGAIAGWVNLIGASLSLIAIELYLHSKAIKN
jgi:Fuc2NAc and GlcNAc transferase